MKKLIPEDGKLDVSQCGGYDTVTVLAGCILLFFSNPIVKGILLDLLLRVNNLRPRCCRRVDVFLDVVSCRSERLSAVIFQDAAEI